MSTLSPRSQIETRTILADVLPLDSPYVVGIFTGDLCNFKCAYCAQSIDPKDEKGLPDDLIRSFLSWDTFSKINEDLKTFPQKIKKVLFSSIGEPLLHKNLPQMIQAITENKNVETTELVTNASLLTHELSDALVNAGLNRICVSVQGVTPQKYEEICNYRIDYDKFCAELAYLFAITRNTPTKIHIKTVDLALEPDEKDIFFKDFGPISDTLFIDHIIDLYEGVDYKPIIKEPHSHIYTSSTDAPEVVERVFVCPPLFYTLYINPAGEIVPCCRTPYPVRYGNVKETSLFDAWNSEKRKNFLLFHLQKRRLSHPICKACPHPDSATFETDRIDECAAHILQKIG